MSCKDRNCVCEAVEAILDAQEEVQDRCPTSCFSDLLSPVAFRGDTIPFMLFTKKGKPVHIVCGKRDDWLVIITVYIPTPPKFKTPYERA